MSTLSNSSSGFELDGKSNKERIMKGNGLQRSKSTPISLTGDRLQGRGIKKEKKPPNYPVRNQVFYRFGDENFTVGVVTMQGKREEMEDDHDVRLKFSKKPDCGFFGIFDGHSGSEAASWVAKNLSNLFIEELEEYNQDTISGAMLKADEAFLNSGIDVLNGTTAVFAITKLLKDNMWEITVGNLGDSRCIVGNYSNEEFTCMTTDHKPTDAIETQRVSEAGGFVALKRVDGILAVSRSIGDGTYKNIPDLPPEKQKVIPIPDVTHKVLDDDNFLFICCDGIFETFTNDEAIKFIHEKSKVTDDICVILSELLYAVLDKGSKDNMSAMIVKKKSGVEHHRDTHEFVVGEFFPNGTDIYHSSYEYNCAKYGVAANEAKKMWLEKKALIESKRLEGLTLEILRKKYCNIETPGSVALHQVFGFVCHDGKEKGKGKSKK